MSFGKRLLELRKRKGLSQEDLAEMIGTKGPAIGRYERDAGKPSLDAIIKLASILDVSIDYLLGNTNEEVDQQNLKRMLAIQQLPKDIQEKVYYFIDISIRDTKAQQAYSS
jgi:transcriptional regulator with XRE-family HTH domain